MLEGREMTYSKTEIGAVSHSSRAAATQNAVAANRFLTSGTLPDALAQRTRLDLATFMGYCGGEGSLKETDAVNALLGITASVIPYLTREESRKSLLPILQGRCITRLGSTGHLVVELVKRILERDSEGMLAISERLLEQLPKDADRRQISFALDAAMVGAIVNGNPGYAHTLWQRHGPRVHAGGDSPIDTRLMLALASAKLANR
jgi:hypothetical protein